MRPVNLEFLHVDAVQLARGYSPGGPNRYGAWPAAEVEYTEAGSQVSEEIRCIVLVCIAPERLQNLVAEAHSAVRARRHLGCLQSQFMAGR